MGLPYDLAVTFLEMYPGKANISIQKDLCIPMFTAAQFEIAKMETT